MTCVCGHGRFAHTSVAASVPLVRKPDDPAPTVMPTIYRSHPTATYTQDLCHCGCSQFEELA